MQQELLERLTRSLAYMLRHQPEEFDLELDEEGFAEVEDVLDALSDEGRVLGWGPALSG